MQSDVAVDLGTVRAPTDSDAPDVAALFGQATPHAELTADDIRARWLEPSVRDASRVCERDGRVWAYLEVAPSDPKLGLDAEVEIRREIDEETGTSVATALLNELDIDRVRRIVVDGLDGPMAVTLTADGWRPVRQLLHMNFDLQTSTGVTVMPSDLPWAPTPIGVSIRRFNDDDEKALYSFMHDALDGWGLSHAMDLDTWREAVVQRASNPTQLWLVAERDGEIIGALLGTEHEARHGTVGRITQLAVAPEHRQQGVARALLRVSFKRFEQVGLSQVDLDVDDETLDGAARLYRDAGMRVASHTTVYERRN